MMINKLMAFLVSIILLFSGVNVDYGEKVESGEYVGLKNEYSQYFDIGACVASWYTFDQDTVDFLLKNFSSFTPELEFKLSYIHPSEDEWVFIGPDILADFCRANNIKLRGHCLVWGNANNWMFYDENGGFVDKETYFARQYEYMQTVMTRYGDVVKVWDVVNEPFNFDKNGAFKNCLLYQLYGEEYVTKAYEQAREIAPDATLVLNETGLLKNDTKQKYFFNYMKKWLDAGVPIDAVGIQAHWKTFSASETPRRLDSMLEKITKLGLKEIQITEMDLTLYPSFVNNDYESIPQWMRDFQCMRFKQFFKIFRKYSDNISSVTFWGICDGNNFNRIKHPNDEMLLFDENMKPKNSYFGVIDFE